MKSLMQEIQVSFRDFVKRSRYNLLIVPCEPEHSALLLKSLEAIDDDPAIADIFLIFGHEFDTSVGYVSEVLASVRQQYDRVNEELAIRGDPALVPFPGELNDVSVSPETRLTGTIRHVRTAVPGSRQ